MFSQTAAFYDAIYSFKNYAAEVEKLRELIGVLNPSARTLLDVACGTGKHLELLAQHFEAQGIDLDNGLLTIARQRLPTLQFHHADMTTFELGQQFDVITCLFSSIGYVQTLDKLNASVERMAAHLNPGGVLIVEPWFDPLSFRAGFIGMVTVNEPELKLVRMNESSIAFGADGVPQSFLNFHYLIGIPGIGIETHFEKHQLGLFTREHYETAFLAAGLEPNYDPVGLMDRGLYTAVKR